MLFDSPLSILKQTKMDFLLGNQRRMEQNLGIFLTVYDNAIRDQIDKLTSGLSENLQFKLFKAVDSAFPFLLPFKLSVHVAAANLHVRL